MDITRWVNTEIKLLNYLASLLAQMIKSLSVMQESQVQSLVWEDPLEKEMATHLNILAWKVPWTKEPGELQSMGLQRVRHNRGTNREQREYSLQLKMEKLHIVSKNKTRN